MLTLPIPGVPRPAQVERLLGKRGAAKTAKEYALADAMAAKLRTMGVCYVDERQERGGTTISPSI